MVRNLLRTSFAWALSIGVIAVGIFSFSLPSQAVELETQQYFVKQIVKDKILAVSPNFRGELTQASLLPSLTEISADYHIRATKAIKAEKLNGKLVPGLIVYVETKLPSVKLANVVANKPN